MSMFVMWSYLKFVLICTVLVCAGPSTRVPLAIVVIIADTVVTLVQAMAYDTTKEKISKLRVSSGVLAGVFILGSAVAMVLKPGDSGFKELLMLLGTTVVSQGLVYSITSFTMKKASTRSDKIIRTVRDTAKTAVITSSAVGATVGGVVGSAAGATVDVLAAGMSVGRSEAATMLSEIAENQKQRLDEKVIDGDCKDMAMSSIEKTESDYHTYADSRSEKVNRAFNAIIDGSFEVAKVKAASMGITIDDRSDAEIAADILTFSTPAMLKDIPEEYTDIEKAACLLGKE